MLIYFAVRRRVLLAVVAWIAVCIPSVSQSASTGPKAVTCDVGSIQPNRSGNNTVRIQNFQAAMGVSLKTLEEQLGLKLESTKRLVDTVVVVYVAMPSEN